MPIRVEFNFIGLFAAALFSWNGGVADAQTCDRIKAADGGVAEVREAPSLKSPLLPAGGSGVVQGYCRLDGTANVEGDWIRVEQGWIAAGQVVSSFPPARAKLLLEELSAKIVRRLMVADLKTLAAYVHPIKGVSFSPHAFVVKGADVRLSRRELRFAWAGRSSRIWGNFDGTGEAIRLTFRAYFSRFVRDVDFAEGTWSFADNASPPGATHDNSAEEYPNAITVQSAISSKDGRTILRLIFEQYGGRWYLVHVVHDQWTI